MNSVPARIKGNWEDLLWNFTGWSPCPKTTIKLQNTPYQTPPHLVYKSKGANDNLGPYCDLRMEYDLHENEPLPTLAPWKWYVEMNILLTGFESVFKCSDSDESYETHKYIAVRGADYFYISLFQDVNMECMEVVNTMYIEKLTLVQVNEGRGLREMWTCLSVNEDLLGKSFMNKLAVDEELQRRVNLFLMGKYEAGSTLKDIAKLPPNVMLMILQLTHTFTWTEFLAMRNAQQL